MQSNNWNTCVLSQEMAAKDYNDLAAGTHYGAEVANVSSILIIQIYKYNYN